MCGGHDQGTTAGGEGADVVGLIVTDLCLFAHDRGADELQLLERAPGVTLDEVRAKIAAAFSVVPAPISPRASRSAIKARSSGTRRSTAR